jgi:hypothetical protein
MSEHFIVTPVLNAIRTIDRTIWSIVAQAGDLDIHYHVQDGASTDGTLERLQQWSRRLERIGGELAARLTFTFASEPDDGMYAAIARGFARMKIPPSAFMNWCNADDILWPGALDSIGRLGSQLPEVDWIMGWPTWIDPHGRLIAIDRKPHFPRAVLAAGLADGFHWPFVQQESTFWRKSLLDRAGGVNTAVRLAGDWDLWRRFARVAPLVHVQRQLGAFCVRPGQQSGDLQTYRAELDRVIPRAQRQRALRDQWAQSGADLAAVVSATERPDGTWQREQRRSGLVAGWFAPCLRFARPCMPLAMKLFYRAW